MREYAAAHPAFRPRTEGGAERSVQRGYTCDVPAKVVIRVRAVFKRPTTFSVDPRFPDNEDAKGDIATGYIAVSTLRGRKPIAFASVHDASGKARVSVARSGCSRTN
jgi:hypothetical protein